MRPHIIELCDTNLKKSNTKSRNDFIEEAIKHYVNYLNIPNNDSYLNESITSVINASLNLSAEKTNQFLFKLAVELSILMNIIGAYFDIDILELDKLREKCINDVKESIGTINLEDIVLYQKEEEDG